MSRLARLSLRARLAIAMVGVAVITVALATLFAKTPSSPYATQGALPSWTEFAASSWREIPPNPPTEAESRAITL